MELKEQWVLFFFFAIASSLKDLSIAKALIRLALAFSWVLCLGLGRACHWLICLLMHTRITHTHAHITHTTHIALRATKRSCRQHFSYLPKRSSFLPLKWISPLHWLPHWVSLWQSERLAVIMWPFGAWKWKIVQTTFLQKVLFI